VNAQLASDPSLAGSQIHRFAILDRELSADDGALTRTGKLRRHVIAEQYRALVDAMYSGRTGVRFGAEPDEVKIRDAKITAPTQIRKVA
jgi:long-chain acyl-CoA synthetase